MVAKPNNLYQSRNQRFKNSRIKEKQILAICSTQILTIDQKNV